MGFHFSNIFLQQQNYVKCTIFFQILFAADQWNDQFWLRQLFPPHLKLHPMLFKKKKKHTHF